MLLEREKFLSELNNQFQKALCGEGQAAVIYGDAGIGKTSLVEYFTRQQEDKAQIFWGACDDLFTPRPLAPFYDIVNKMQSRLIEILEKGAARPSVFTSIINEIHKSEPNIIVIEDVHWADESTLDLIKFLIKRINKYRSFLIVTYRSDEVSFNNTLRLAFSNIGTANLKRFELPPLSKNAINILAKNSGRKDNLIFSKTGGNPFFIKELLLHNQKNIPATIKELIISKLNRLSPEARSAVEILSVIPGSVEKWLVNILIKNYTVIDEAVECGILKSDNYNIAFKHELMKTAVEESLTETKRVKNNSIVLNILLNQKNKEPFLARIIHHASKTADSKVITKYAPLAAKQASKFNAHNEALKLYNIALQYAGDLSKEEYLNLLEGKVYEAYLTARIDEGIKACVSINDILKDHKDPLREGENLRKLSRLLWYSGKDKEGEEYLIKAIKILEKYPPGKQLAMSYSNLSQIYMLREDKKTAVKYGEKAVKLAKKLNDIEIESHALNNIGTVKLITSDESGEEILIRSLNLALQNELHEHACRAYVNLGTVNLYRRNLSEADKYFSLGVDCANEKDINVASLCIAGELAQIKLHLGKWDETIEICRSVSLNAPVLDKLLPVTIIGLIKARKNEPGAFQYLDEADELVESTGEVLKIVKLQASRAEVFWLKNKLQENINELIGWYNKIKKGNNPWAIGEIAYWLWKGGGLSEFPKLIAEPYKLQILGKWHQAAKIWEELNCPYEQALALSEGNEEAMKSAIKIFDDLGASAASQLIKQKMRTSGIKNIPKGPRQSTKGNPAGLTGRQMEILNLLAEGLSNSQIANRLYISPRTVENHISSIFSKLNIHSRVEAASLVHKNKIKISIPLS